MEQKVLDFLQSNRVSVLTVLLPDGSPCSSALHYSHQNEPLTLFFSTENTSRKCQGLLKGESAKASVVIGFSEEEWLTLQMDGEVRAVVDKEKLAKVHSIHYPKHPTAEQYKDDPETIFLAFTTNWWRFTDLSTSPYKIICSED